MTRAKRFTLLTSAHVTNNPRLLKEADLLHSAGAEVRVVSLSLDEELAARDRDLSADRGWQLRQVEGGRHGPRQLEWMLAAAGQRSAQIAFAGGLRIGSIADRAASRMLGALEDAAREERADVIIGHNLPALPAAGRAAARIGARLGFDCEDLHGEEESDPDRAASARVLASAVQSRWLPRCEYLTASSDGIATEVARRYGVGRPQVVLNVFPLAMRTKPTSIRDRVDATPSVYWFSQTIGADRGVEEAMSAVAGLPWPVAMHLRGKIAADYRQHLSNHAHALDLAGRFFVHAPAPADEMVALAMQHDIGLASEQPVSVNRLLCVTNKIFVYMTAGLAIAASDTPGQRQIIEQSPGAGFLFAPGSIEGLRAGLWQLLAAGARVAAAKQRSLEAATTRFCWELESPRMRAYLLGGRGGKCQGSASAGL